MSQFERAEADIDRGEGPSRPRTPSSIHEQLPRARLTAAADEVASGDPLGASSLDVTDEEYDDVFGRAAAFVAGTPSRQQQQQHPQHAFTAKGKTPQTLRRFPARLPDQDVDGSPRVTAALRASRRQAEAIAAAAAAAAGKYDGEESQESIFVKMPPSDDEEEQHRAGGGATLAMSPLSKKQRGKSRAAENSGETKDTAHASGFSHTLAASQQRQAQRRGDSSSGGLYPPSFAESQFATIIRRQRKRRVFSPLDHALEQGELQRGASAENQDGVKPGSLEEAEAQAGHEEEEEEEDDNGKRKRGRVDSNLGSSEANLPFPLDSEEPQQLKFGRSAGLGGPDDTSELGRHAWEFSGWGSCALLDLRPRDWARARAAIAARPPRDLGQASAAAIAGNAITGSVLYTLPAVLAVAGVYAPISIFIACLLIGPFRPLLVELSSALGASDSVNYGYMSNISTRSMALVAAAVTALDALATGAVSASTAAAYLDGETAGRVGTTGWTVVLLAALVLVACFGFKDSTRVAVAMIACHLLTMAVLIGASAVHWARSGSAVLRDNWANAAALTGDKPVARAVFDGVCLGFVGLTGFECSLAYVTRVKKGEFAKALRWLQIIVLTTEAPLMLFCLAAIPSATLGSSETSSSNILATLGEVVGNGSPWLKIIVIVDAVIVLGGGIITGIVSFNGLTEALGR